jgi:hypothetical protein
MSQPSTQPAVNLKIQFQGRTIDLDPYLNGFKVASPLLDIDSGHFFHKKNGTPIYLHSLKFEPGKAWDLSSAKAVTATDIGRRNFWKAAFNPSNGKTYTLCDLNADEKMNIFEVAPSCVVNH